MVNHSSINRLSLSLDALVLQGVANKTAIPTGRAAIDVVARKVFCVTAELLGNESNREGGDFAPVLRELTLDLQELQLEREAQPPSR